MQDRAEPGLESPKRQLKPLLDPEAVSLTRLNPQFQPIHQLTIPFPDTLLVGRYHAMAKDDHVRDAEEIDLESTRLLSESPSPIEDDGELVVHKNPQSSSASHTDSNHSPSLRASNPQASTVVRDAASHSNSAFVPSTITNPNSRPLHTRRQSSFAQHRPDGTPRTPNRVRFEVDNREAGTNTPTSPRPPQANGFPVESHGHARHVPNDPSWLEEEDYMASPVDGTFNGIGSGLRRESGGQRVPLLTDIEAPSITVATPGGWEEGDEETDIEEIMVGGGRTKSGMKSAFMNMANSIMYVSHFCAGSAVDSFQDLLQ